MTEPRDRPRPTPDGSARRDAADGTDPVALGKVVEPVPIRDVPTTPPARGAVRRLEVQPSQLVAATGAALVASVRVGRLLGRAGWRIARQLPGGRTVEREAQRLQDLAASELRRIVTPAAAPTAEERAAVNYVRTTDPAAAPLRSAMNELLERSVESTRADSRSYLFGTIVSQLVPDEARILAAMADGTRFAAADVVLKKRRGSRVLLANFSSVGRQAGLLSPDNVPTYLNRLHGFGLIEFGPDDESLHVQYDILATDRTVQDARRSVDNRNRGAVRLEHKTVFLSAFGREFWAATDPSTR